MIKENKRLFALSLPIFVELFLQLLVGNVDQIMLSRYSQDSVAAVGNCNQVMNIAIIAISVTCGATTILISQYLGMNNRKKISEVQTVSTMFIAVCSIVISLIVTIGSRGIFNMIDLPSHLMKEARTYLILVGSFIVVQGLYMNVTAILRAYSHTTCVMVASIIMNVMNMVGNAVLIYGIGLAPRLGLTGAAISTNISKTTGLLVALYFLKKKIPDKMSFIYVGQKGLHSLKKLLWIGIPTCLESTSYNLSQMYIMKFINTLGKTAGIAVINTKVYCSILANIAYVYSIAISQAAQILIGYMIGEGKREQIHRRIWSAVVISLIFSLSITSIMYLNSDNVLRIFTDDPEVLSLGKQILFVEFFLEIGRSVNIAMTKVLIAVGDVIAPTVIGVIFQWGAAVTLSYIFGIKMGYGLVGIWIAMAIDENVRGIIFMIRFISGAWKKKSALV